MPPTDKKPDPKYQHQEYPKMLYKKDKEGNIKSMTAASADHEAISAKGGWGDHPETVAEGESVAPSADDPDAPPSAPGEEHVRTPRPFTPPVAPPSFGPGRHEGDTPLTPTDPQSPQPGTTPSQGDDTNPTPPDPRRGDARPPKPGRK